MSLTDRTRDAMAAGGHGRMLGQASHPAAVCTFFPSSAPHECPFRHFSMNGKSDGLCAASGKSAARPPSRPVRSVAPRCAGLGRWHRAVLACRTMSGSFRGVLVTITVTTAGWWSEVWPNVDCLL
jgi:hypothetical protein